MSKLDMHSVTLKVRDIASFYGTGFGNFGWGKYTQANAFNFLIFSFSDNNFRKSLMICQIIDSVDNHFGEYL